tara:strand:- start:847 stop:1038 length:192 start_codon:yes stop_codon:yes gene_type:complete
MMTRKDFVKIGTILRENGASEKPAIIEAFVEMFSEENPRFDEDKFKEFVRPLKELTIPEGEVI